MADTYTLIEKITVGAAEATDVTFTSIPQTFTDLKLVWSGRQGDGSAVRIQFNGDTSTANYSQRRVYGNGSTVTSDSSTTLGWFNPIGLNSSLATASTFSNCELYIPNYTGSTNKSISADTVLEDNTTSTLYSYQTLSAGLWSQTSAITSIKITPNTGNLAQYSTFYLYGIAKEGVNPSLPSAPYATGGDSILFDGTYWIHTFLSSGTFTPKKSLTCDYLVIAGGGSGGGGAGGVGAGGGGAGGYKTSIGGSALTLNANTGYTVTIGAGGAGQTAGSTNGNNGSNSVFSTITSTGGGYGGGYNNQQGGNGGSGGGGGSAGGASGGTGTTGEGSNGGSGSTGGGQPYRGGGGGGAGAAGATGDASGNGGAGLASSITGSSVTRAGGGGGAGNLAGGAGGSGGGGAGATGSGANGVAGTANTGSGGGGMASTSGSTSGAGGSGIVIVRYAA